MPVETSLLSADHLVSGYGGVQVLWDVSVDVNQNETVVLLGPNGAGKSTLIKVLVGILGLWSGDVALQGRIISRERADQRVRSGLAYMSEVGCFLDLTVHENLVIGSHLLARADALRRIGELYDRFPTLKQKSRALGGSLSGGQRKILGVAKALAGRPKLLMMDEPSSGLSPLFVTEVIDALHSSTLDGVALLIAEQNVRFLDLADRVYILDGGHINFSGTVESLHRDMALERAYFGLG